MLISTCQICLDKFDKCLPESFIKCNDSFGVCNIAEMDDENDVKSTGFKLRVAENYGHAFDSRSMSAIIATIPLRYQAVTTSYCEMYLQALKDIGVHNNNSGGIYSHGSIQNWDSFHNLSQSCVL